MSKDYYIDSADEAMYLEMLEDMDFETAETIYHEVHDTLPGAYLSNIARQKTFEELTYKNLRYLILGCERCGAELRVKALATFIFRASLSTRLNPLVNNGKLSEMLFKNLEDNIETVYGWSRVKYPNGDLS